MASAISFMMADFDLVLTFPDGESRKEYFPYDPDVTDFTLVSVEKKELHVAKVVLIDASPVFTDLKGRTHLCQDLKFKGKTIPVLKCFFDAFIHENIDSQVCRKYLLS